MRVLSIVLSCFVLAGGNGLVAQERRWSLTAETGLVRFSGSASGVVADAPGEPVSVGPDRTTALGARLSRDLGGASVGVGIWYAESGVISESSSGAIIVDQLRFHLFELAPEIGARLLTFGAARTVRIHAGPILDHWTARANRTRLGVQAALSLEIPLGRRWGGTVRAGWAATGSVFNADEVGSEVNRRSTRRRMLTLGLHHQL